MSVRSTVTRNTAYNGVGRAWDAILTLVLIAYAVSRIGTAQYGLWAVAGAFTGYAALFDPGIGSAYAKFIAEHRARNETRDISSVVTTGLVFYLGFSALFLAVTLPLLDTVMDALARMDLAAFGDFADESVRADLRFLLQWGLVIFALSNLLAPFTAVQSGFQRFGAINAISMTLATVKLGSAIYFIEAGHGVRGLLYANAVVLGVFAVLTTAAAFVIFPPLRIGPRFVRRATFRKLISFGWRTQVARLSNLVMFETDVLVIAILLRDLQLAGLYRIGVELANKMRQVPGLMLSALMPAASELDARSETARLRRVYLAASKYIAVCAAPIAFWLAGGAELVIQAWQSTLDGSETAAMVLRIMALGYLANMIPGAGVAIALGMGRPDLQMKAGLISMTTNIALTVWLALQFGFWGIPIATALSMVVSWWWFAHAMRDVLGVSRGDLARESVAWPLLAGTAVFGVCIVGESVLPAFDGRLAAGAAIAALGAIGTGVYLVLLRVFPVFDASDIGFFDNTLRLARLPGYQAWSQTMRSQQP